MTTTNGNANGTAAIEPHTNGSSPAGYSTSGTVRAVSINSEMQTAYLDYAMSVIVSRALPDVRDGLKPVHRRILYAMYRDLGLTADKPHRKSARIVGEVLGKYHPHGDSAVYDAMVRMAQDFSLRYPLVDGQGNFGSIDGDNAAAMRYTEARLAPISNLMLEDLEKDTVDWHENFDNSLMEPDILPAALPNLLINGSSGIAVGMATNIPPHNLSEVVDALAYMIDRYDEVDEITVEQLMQFIKGPDFPTGGILYRYREAKKDEDDVDAIAQGYGVGRARLILQAKAHFEEMSRNRKRIVITELPYQTNKTTLIERIASLVRDGKIEGVTDLRDESDRAGMRIVIELTRNVDPKRILELLFKYTPLQQTFGMQMLALVEDEPRTLSLKRMLLHFVQHRQVIIRRRSEFDLNRAKERAHIVEGLLRALDILDEVIATIRRSQRVDTARTNLMKNFGFTQVQAQAILDMQLRRLAALERKKLQDEFKELQKRIAYLEDLLAHPEKILAVIKADLLKIKEEYGDARRTQIVERTKGTLTSTDLLPDQEVWVSVSEKGQLKRRDVTTISATTSRQAGKGAELALLTANTRDYLYLFHESGQCRRVAIHEIPGSGSGKHLAELTEFSRRDTITAALALPREPVDMDGYLFLVTRQGMVKRITLADFQSAAAMDPQVFNVDSGDQLGWVFATRGEQEVILVSSGGQSIRFKEEDVRSMGLAAGGVGGMKLKQGQRLVHAEVVDPRGELMTITATGYAKRTSLEEYSTQGRNGQGVVTHKPSKRTGDVVAALVLPEGALLQSENEWVIVVPNKGAAHPIAVANVPQMGRSVQGNQIVALDMGSQVANLQRLTLPAAPLPPEQDGSGKDEGGASAAPSTRGGSAKKGTASKGRASAKRSQAPSARKSTAKKATAKKPSASKATPKKTTGKTSTAKKTTTKQSTANKATSSKAKSGKTAPDPKTGAAPPGSSRTRAPAKKRSTSAKASDTKASTKTNSTARKRTTKSSKTSSPTRATASRSSSASSPSSSTTSSRKSSSRKTASGSKTASSKAKPEPKTAKQKSGSAQTRTSRAKSSGAKSTRTTSARTKSTRTTKKAAETALADTAKTTSKSSRRTTSKTKAKKSGAKGAGGKTATPKKTAPKKTTAQKSTAKNSTAKKTAATEKSSAKKAPAKKPASSTKAAASGGKRQPKKVATVASVKTTQVSKKKRKSSGKK